MESNTENSPKYFQNDLPVAHAAYLESMMAQFGIKYPQTIILTWSSHSQSLINKEKDVFLPGLHWHWISAKYEIHIYKNYFI